MKYNSQKISEMIILKLQNLSKEYKYVKCTYIKNPG